MGTPMEKSGNMVLKGVNWVHDNIRSYDKIMGQIWSFKGVNWVHNNKIRSNDIERSQLGTLTKLGQMVLK